MLLNYITLKGDSLREMVPFIGDDRKHTFRWLDLSVDNRGRDGVRSCCEGSPGWRTRLQFIFCMPGHR